jgi:hypothetical protein
MCGRQFCYACDLCVMLFPMRVFSAQKQSCSAKSFPRPTSIPFDYVLN